jgi:polyisoprenoid-binding protein YceI
MTTVTSGDDARDNHLKSADFFDVANNKTATFVSTNVNWDGTSGSMAGMLTIKDVTAPATFTIDYLGHVLDPWHNERTVFSARSKVNRSDWHLTWNMPLARGGLLVSTEIDLELEVELVLDR